MISTTILNVISVFSALSVIVLTLLQHGKSDVGSAFGGGGGSSQSMFGSRGSANFLSRMTALMCTVFFISSLALAYQYSKRTNPTNSVVNSSVTGNAETVIVDPSIEDVIENKVNAEVVVPVTKTVDSAVVIAEGTVKSVEAQIEAKATIIAEPAKEGIKSKIIEAVDVIKEKAADATK